MIFLKFTERIWDSSGNPKQVLSSPFHSCIHQIISPYTVQLSMVMEWLIPLYAFACLRCCSPFLRTPFPCSCLFFFLIVILGVQCWHCCWSICRLYLSTRSWTWPLMSQLPVASEWKVMKGCCEYVHLLSFLDWAYRTMYIYVGLDLT